jgi:cell division transport system permease protein
MTLIDLKRIIRSGFQNFTRNSFVSLSSILIMVVTLSVAGLLLLSRAVLSTTIETLENKVDITVFFDLGANENTILELQKEVDAIPEVASSEYVSATQALINFRERHQDDELTLKALDELGGNPLGAMLNIRAVNPEDYGIIAETLGDQGALSESSLEVISKINYYQNEQVINRLVSITNGARTLGTVLLIILAVISVVITLNTIRLTIYSARQEIGVMRLVGAGTKYVRGPFIVEGILYGLVSSVVTMILFFPITLWLGEKMGAFLGVNLHTYYLSNFFQFLIILLIVGIILGTVSSAIAVRRYLNH